MGIHNSYFGGVGPALLRRSDHVWIFPKADPKLLSARMEVARQKLYEAGAHFVIDTVNDLPEVVEEINERIKEANFY